MPFYFAVFDTDLLQGRSVRLTREKNGKKSGWNRSSTHRQQKGSDANTRRNRSVDAHLKTILAAGEKKEGKIAAEKKKVFIPLENR